ncbi:SPRY-domain-containing protein [Gigaspora margarita]|uniref:SPRY-domain-containing protein n=1 Tax=Gigaspora margarita TaxID=4874 RepID=A0A8H4AVY6_GIGMA|nr:SPRY-domain-containing protein [Gigaspora margarita]
MKSPAKWNINDKSEYLDVEFNGLRVNYKGPANRWVDSGIVRADHPIPQCVLFYFEVTIIDKGNNGIIGIGFCTRPDKIEPKKLNTMPGWAEILKNRWNKALDMGNYELLSKQEVMLEELIKSLKTESHMAKAYFIIGRNEEALELTNSSNNAFSLRYRGETYYMMRMYDKSLYEFEKLSIIEPNSLWTLNAYKEVTRKKDRYIKEVEKNDYIRQECPDFLERREISENLNDRLRHDWDKKINFEEITPDMSEMDLQLFSWAYSSNDPEDREVVDQLMVDREARMEEELEDYQDWDYRRDC